MAATQFDGWIVCFPCQEAEFAWETSITAEAFAELHAGCKRDEAETTDS